MSKNISEGHACTLDAERVRNGLVVRKINIDGSIPPFSDSVVVGICFEGKFNDLVSFVNLMHGLNWVGERNYQPEEIKIELARPYLYSDTVGIYFNYLQGAERFSIDSVRFLKDYSAIQMSDGSLAVYCNRKAY